tara:strand:- start:302 stop:781 length:480 start_codon:yes stop_codon:yes gene_type:complete
LLINFQDIKKLPVDLINKLETQSDQNSLNSNKFDSKFLLNNEGMSIFWKKSLVGYILAKIALDQADIISFIIKKEFRRKKYGTILFTKFVNYLKTKGVESIFLEVSKKNIPALNFYFCIGFERVGYRHNYYKNKNGNVDAEVLMSPIDTIMLKVRSLIQ